MVIKSVLIVVLIFLSATLKSQTKEYLITPETTAEIIVKYKNAFWLRDADRKTIDFPIYDTTYVETEHYLKYADKLDTLIKDSTSLMNDYVLKKSVFEEQMSMVSLIDNFLNSNAKFKEKKQYLLKAQEISIKYKYDNLIYADKTFNSARKSEFFLLKIDQDKLRSHLIKQRNELTRNLHEPRNPYGYNYKYSELYKIRKYISGIQKLEQKLTQVSSYQAEGIIIGSEIENLTKIEGIYRVIGEYKIMKYSYGGYAKNQLVLDSIISQRKLRKHASSKEALIEEINTGKLYYGTDRFIYNCGTDMTLIRFIEKLNKLGFKTVNNGDKIIITTSKGQLVLTHDIYENVNEGNPNYINEIASSVQQFNSLVSQAKPLQDKLVNHFNAYQHATLSSTRLNQWKSDVSKAQKLYEKAYSLKGREFKNIENFQKQIEISKIKQFNEFTEVLRGSKVILGM